MRLCSGYTDGCCSQIPRPKHKYIIHLKSSCISKSTKNTLKVTNVSKKYMLSNLKGRRHLKRNHFSCVLTKDNLYINLACLSVCLLWCLSVCLYSINVKTAEPIGPKFFVGHLGAPGKVHEWSKFQIFVSIKIRSSLNFWKFWKSTKIFVKIRELFLFCFTMYTKRTCLQLI